MANKTVVAIDLDARGAYVVRHGDGALTCGFLQLPHYPPENLGALLQRQAERFYEIIATLAPDVVVAEITDWHRGAPDGDVERRRVVEAQNRSVARALGRLEGVLACVCHFAGCIVVFAPVHSVKKQFTRGYSADPVGNSNANKSMVAFVARQRFPNLCDWGAPASQPIADACAVLWWYEALNKRGLEDMIDDGAD